MNTKSFAIAKTLLLSLSLASTNLVAIPAVSNDSQAEKGASLEMETNSTVNNIASQLRVVVRQTDVVFHHEKELNSNIRDIFKEFRKVANNKLAEIEMVINDTTTSRLEKLSAILKLQKECLTFVNRVGKFNYWITLFCDGGLKNCREGDFRDFLNQVDSADFQIFLRWVDGKFNQIDFLTRN